MKRVAAALIPCFVLAIAFAATPTSAAEEKKSADKSSADAVVAAPGNKPERSVTNPNDGKDTDPDDGDAGKGNDNKPPRP